MDAHALHADRRPAQASRDEVLVVVPARLDARRYPGKALARLDGAPMVCHVVARAREAWGRGEARVVVATDAPAIAAAVEGLRAEGVCEVALDARAARCGSERAARVAEGSGARWVVNVQGDEPCVPAEALRAVLARVQRGDVVMASACVPMDGAAGFTDPDQVKAVVDSEGLARYFSRAPIPHGAVEAGEPWRLHVGVYAYSAPALARFAALGVSTLERLEGLEQLRALEAGWAIGMVELTAWRGRAWPSVNRPADRAAAEVYLRRTRGGGGASGFDAATPGAGGRVEPG